MWLIRPSALRACKRPSCLTSSKPHPLSCETCAASETYYLCRDGLVSGYSDSYVDASAIHSDDDEDLGSIETAGERDPSGDSDGEQISQAIGPSIERTQVSVTRGKKTKRQNQMSKAERQRLMTQVCRVDINSYLSSCTFPCSRRD